MNVARPACPAVGISGVSFSRTWHGRLARACISRERATAGLPGRGEWRPTATTAGQARRATERLATCYGGMGSIAKTASMPAQNRALDHFQSVGTAAKFPRTGLP